MDLRKKAKHRKAVESHRQFLRTREGGKYGKSTRTTKQVLSGLGGKGWQLGHGGKTGQLQKALRQH